MAEPGPAGAFTPYPGGLKFDNMGIGGLVNYLANILSQPVQDKTGLTGRYTFSLELRPPEAVPGQLPQAVDVAWNCFFRGAGAARPESCSRSAFPPRYC